MFHISTVILPLSPLLLPLSVFIFVLFSPFAPPISFLPRSTYNPKILTQIYVFFYIKEYEYMNVFCNLIRAPNRFLTFKRKENGRKLKRDPPKGVEGMKSVISLTPSFSLRPSACVLYVCMWKFYTFRLIYSCCSYCTIHT